MNFTNFKNKPNIEFQLLKYLDVITEESKILKIDNNPDYDLTGYDKFRAMTYFFEFDYEFSDEYSNVLWASISKERLMHYDDVVNASNTYGIEWDNDNYDDVAFLNKLHKLSYDVLDEYGHNPDNDTIKLQSIRLNGIDNVDKKISFSGTYFGCYEAIDPMDWGIYIECDFVGSKLFNGDEGKFYQELLAQAYSLRETSNYKLSFFTIFSALENFTNEKMSTHNTAERFSDILKRMIKNSVPDFSKNIIYSSIIGSYSTFEMMRNNIAHGRAKIIVKECDVNDVLLFTLLVICLAEGKADNFASLFSTLQQIN
ncbi:hypothetical protein [Citrobacter freundii]|uniref:hypothetical protein n=1 Tax=Citrobacter freundii TaxID=546 RepID=UPI002A503138|nr:hypothetical protein [Citrobacter freundii]